MYKLLSLFIRAAYDMLDKGQEMIAIELPEDTKIIMKLKTVKLTVWQLLTEIDPGAKI